MFERFWRRLRGQAGEDHAGHDNRRAHQRFPTDLETNCQPVNGALPRLRVRVRNVSKGGMNFLTEHRLEPGTLLRIDLPQGAPAADATVLACVMHCAMQTDGRYSIGCSFSDELGDSALREFGARKEPGSEDDKRAWMRFTTQGQAEYLVLPPTGEPAKPARIVNISPTGIGLLLDEKIEPGTILDLLLKTKGGPAFDILACVVFLGARDEGGWIAGCHFVRELEDADLKRLV